MRTYIVCESAGSGMGDRYAHELMVNLATTVAYIAEEMALWPNGTQLTVWRVTATDAGSARLVEPDMTQATFTVDDGDWTHVT